MNELTHVDLFSGIGGFALAAGWAGFRTVAFSEVDPYACKVLAERWPGVPNVGDVRIASNFARFRGATVLTGGFPCQPWSAAGKRGGANDDRHLWPAMLRVIETVRPAWVIGENVPGLDHMGQLDACCDDLAALGYESQPFEIPACAVDAPHLRDRLWIVANASGRRFGGPVKGQVEQPRGAEVVGPSATANPDRARVRHESKHVGGGGDPAQLNHDGEARSLADTDRTRELQPQGCKYDQRGRSGDGSEALADSNSERRNRAKERSDRQRGTSQVECPSKTLANANRDERDGRSGNVQMGRIGSASETQADGHTGGTQWLSEPGVGRVAHGIPNRAHRLKGLGNSIVPQVVAPFFRWIAEIENAT